jgi:uncharacterized protein YjbI with pentapeptide repeats
MSQPSGGQHVETRDHAGENFAGMDLSGRSLVDWILDGADLTGADLSSADLSGASLEGAKLQGALLVEANLHGANLHKCHAEGANFRRARLIGATLAGGHFDEADFVEADLTKVRARMAGFPHADLTRTRLTDADFSRSDLRRVKLFGSHVHGAHFERTDLRGGHLAGMRGYEHAEWKNVDIRDIDLHGTYLARRFIADQNFIHEFRGRGPTSEAAYFLWWLTSNCGRSISRWGLLTALLMVAFAKAYTYMGIDYGIHETWISPFYFSVVTLTSLGFGDVVPATATAQAVAMLEVTCGYVMLGGLLSIFSTKMARRAE